MLDKKTARSIGLDAGLRVDVVDEVLGDMEWYVQSESNETADFWCQWFRKCQKEHPACRQYRLDDVDDNNFVENMCHHLLAFGFQSDVISSFHLRVQSMNHELIEFLRHRESDGVANQFIQEAEMNIQIQLRRLAFDIRFDLA
jgi:hypothetical protein